MLKNMPRQLFTYLYMCSIRLGGCSPLLQIHTHLANVSSFNAEGWRGAYGVIAEILEANKHIRGVFRGSWFIDPVISKISPRLSYLREEPINNGASVFYNCLEDERCGAFSRSKTRRKLFDEGKYIPKSYFLIWPRHELVNFGKSLRGK